MAKKKLSDLVQKQTQASEPTESGSNEQPKLQTNRVTDSVTHKPTKLQTNKVTESDSNELTEQQTNRVTESRSSKLRESSEPYPNKAVAQQPTNQQSNKETDLQSSEVPKYLTLIRKEARLREDQIEALATLSRRLNRQRRGKGERITENTLIRVAVDLLLEQEEALVGVTEDEVRENLTH